MHSGVEKSKALRAPENVHSATLTITGTGRKFVLEAYNNRLAGINSMARADSDWYGYQYGWFGYSASDYFKPTKTDMDSWGNVYVGNQTVDGNGEMSMFRFK